METDNRSRTSTTARAASNATTDSRSRTADARSRDPKENAMNAHRLPLESSLHTSFRSCLALAPLLLFAGCGSGSNGATGPQGPPGGGGPTNTQLERGQDPPRGHLAAVSLAGATGARASFP